LIGGSFSLSQLGRMVKYKKFSNAIESVSKKVYSWAVMS